MSTPDFDAWLAGIPSVTEDHVFTPIGRQTQAMTDLLNERAALIPDDPENPDPEQALGEEGYTERRDRLDALIAAQLEKDHADAPRMLLRGLSDEDLQDIYTEVETLDPDKKWTAATRATEISLRYVTRAAVTPTVTLDQARRMRAGINRGEWGRLLDHITRLMAAEAEAVDLPNS